MSRGSLSVGKRAIPASDFVAVAVDRWTIELDSTAADTIAKGAAKGVKNLPTPDITEFPEASKTLTVQQTRAALFSLIIKCGYGRAGVRKVFVEYLIDLLNKDIHPALRTNDQFDPQPVLAHLAWAFFGLGFDANNAKLGDTLSAAGITAPGLTTTESAVLRSAVPLATGIAALAIHGTSTLIDLADTVSALACEATSAFTEPFQANHHNESRPHRGQIRSAANLRTLLEGSNSVNTRQTKEFDPECIRGIPQYHGPAREATAAVEINVNAEINGAEHHRIENTSAKSGGEFLTQPISSAASRLVQALALVAQGSHARVQQIVDAYASYGLTEKLVHVDNAGGDANGVAPLTQRARDTAAAVKAASARVSAAVVSRPFADAATQGNTIDPVLAIVVAVGSLIELVHHQLTVEAVTMMQALAIKDIVRDREAAAKAKIAAEKAAKAQAQKPKKDDAGPVNEKAAAKRAAKEKKAAEAAAKKAAKRKAFTLGAGTAALRARLVAGGVTVAEKDEDINDRYTSALAVLNPWNRDFGEFLKNLFVAVTSRRVPKVAKGARDFLPHEMVVREKAFGIITNVFKRHGAVTIETPVFEPKETLTGKYGEDTKLIYDLADQGGEMLALRYDLTVPFARFLATNPVGNIKRYHISRVYRRDQPVMTKGRFREFYQCDYDIAGTYDVMIPDSEVLKVLCEILSELPIGPFMVKINHRKLLDSIFALCGVPAEKTRPICSAVDKLDKEPWSAVRDEMVNQKGLDPAVADRIEPFVMQKGSPLELLKTVVDSKQFEKSPTALEALEEMRTLFEYLNHFGIVDRFSFDFSLARGLDYYTGVIYEAVLLDPEVGVGSIAAGGRYDNLVGMFSGQQTPCVGVSIGIERVFAIMQRAANKQAKQRSSQTDVLVVAIPNGKDKKATTILDRMTICQKLWAANVRTEYLYESNPTVKKQLNYANEQGIPNVVLFGEDELARGVVNWKWMDSGAGRDAGDATKNQEEVKLDDLVELVPKLLLGPAANEE